MLGNEHSVSLFNSKYGALNYNKVHEVYLGAVERGKNDISGGRDSHQPIRYSG